MKTIYNPLLEDFSVEYDQCGDNHKTITIKAGDVKQFEDWEADHLKKHLVDRLLNENPPSDHNRDAKRLELEKIVEV